MKEQYRCTNGFRGGGTCGGLQSKTLLTAGLTSKLDQISQNLTQHIQQNNLFFYWVRLALCATLRRKWLELWLYVAITEVVRVQDVLQVIGNGQKKHSINLTPFLYPVLPLLASLCQRLPPAPVGENTVQDREPTVSQSTERKNLHSLLTPCHPLFVPNSILLSVQIFFILTHYKRYTLLAVLPLPVKIDYAMLVEQFRCLNMVIQYCFRCFQISHMGVNHCPRVDGSPIGSV